MVLPFNVKVIFLPFTLMSSACRTLKAELPVSNFASSSPNGSILTTSSNPHWTGVVRLDATSLKCSKIVFATLSPEFASSIPSLPGEELTSKINGGAVLGLADGIKSTAVRIPSKALDASKHCSVSRSDSL